MKQRLNWVVTLLGVAFLTGLVSCGSEATPTPTPSPTPATTSAPAPTRTQAGTLAEIDGDTLYLTTALGQVTVNVAADTSIQKNVTGTLSDLQEGESLTVSGFRNPDGTIVATSVIIRPQGQRAPRTLPTGATPRPRVTPTTPGSDAVRGASGTLTKVVSNTLTLTTAQGEVTVNVVSYTSIQKTVTGTLSDLQEGESLTVFGAQDASGNIAATSIIIRPQGASPSS